MTHFFLVLIFLNTYPDLPVEERTVVEVPNMMICEEMRHRADFNPPVAAKYTMFVGSFCKIVETPE